MADLLARLKEKARPREENRTNAVRGRLLAAFGEIEESLIHDVKRRKLRPSAKSLIEPLTERELEVLALVAEGLTNRQIGERLYLALDTVKGHNRRIFGKLDVQRAHRSRRPRRRVGNAVRGYNPHLRTLPAQHRVHAFRAA